MDIQIQSESVDQTRKIGAEVALQMKMGSVVALVGELGSGKTEFVRGFIGALVPGAPIRSPSFSIVNTYTLPQYQIHHFDFYRIVREKELVDIGYWEYLSSPSICLIEWADLFPQLVPENRVMITVVVSEQTKRVLTISQIPEKIVLT